MPDDWDNDRLPMWVVYDHPRDHPDGFIARMWYSLPRSMSTDRTLTAATIDELRKAIRCQSPGVVRIRRHPQDDQCIVEVWL
jgi:hypothetical protein